MGEKNIIYNIFRGNLIDGGTRLQKDEYKSLVEFIHFKNHDYASTSLKISFPKEIKITLKFKCLNWFTYKHSEYLSFDILKVREYDTNKTFYFQFIKHNYKIYSKELVDKTLELKRLYKIATDFESEEDSLYDIFKIDMKDCKELDVQHYKRYTGKNEFLREGEKMFKTINNVNKKDFVIFKTGFSLNRLVTESGSENTFRDFRFLSVVYNINPSGSYQIEEFNVRQSAIYDNVFFVETPKIKEMFKNILTLPKDVKRNWISFDIESECVPHREIFNEGNIITHLGFEYFSDNYYSDFEKHTESFNFCFINLDFHLRQEIVKKKPFLKDDISMDSLYEIIMNKHYSSEIKKDIEKELKILNNDERCVVYDDQDILSLVQDNKIKFLFCTELEIINLFKSLLNLLKDVDCILSFNGHSYDFSQLSKRFCYLTSRPINKEGLQYISLYKEEKPKFFESKNPNTSFRIINMEMNQHYYSIDLFTYVFKFKPNFDSFSLKEVAKSTYNLKTIIKPVTDIREEQFNICILRYFKDTIKNYSTNNEKRLQELKKREDEYRKSLFKFIQVLLSSNYIYINDIAFKIVDKSKFIQDEESIYQIDINKIIDNIRIENNICVLDAEITIQGIEGRVYNLSKNFKWENYIDFIQTVSLAKDDIEISDKKIFEKQTTFEIAKYCVHDSLLCRYLMKDLNIKENNDVFAQIYFLPQSQAFLFRNSTNFLGYLLKTCYEERCFLQKNNKICTNNYSGGRVFEPQEHFLKEPVMMFDFESLYPSIMINCNISPDTLILVLDLKCMIELTIVKTNIERMFNPQYYSIVYNIRDPIYTIMIFTKIDQDGNPRKGLLSYMLNDLKIKRKSYKKQMKEYYEEGNTFQYVNCDMIQNCIKVLMNSVYGLLGSDFHNISCKFTSQAVTAIGVRSISFLADYFDKAILKNGKMYINNDLDYNPICSKHINPRQVFDLDTGINEEIELKLVYGDTDSVMFIPKGINKLEHVYEQPEDIYKKRSYYYVSCIGNKLSDFINNVVLERNLNLEFESIYFDMMILAKKKYKSLKAEPTNKKCLSIQDMDTIEPEFKIDNKGISLKRRDNCLFHKNCIIKLYQLLHEKISNMKFKDEDIDYNVIGQEIVNFVKEVRIDLLRDVLFDSIKINDFILTSAFKGHYKNKDYPTLVLVQDYNKTARDPISEGERFKFLFQKKFKPKQSLEEIIKTEEEERMTCLLKNMDWGYIEKDITSHRIIYDDTTNLVFSEGNRIFLEIYLSKLRKDIKTMFVNNEDIYKMLNREEKSFVAYNA
ncbi:putative DNA polymerase [Yalta virus]|nr:putative DNA polymerase [Yalta virus]